MSRGLGDVYKRQIRSKWYDGDLICNFLGIEPFDSWTSSVEEWNEFVDVYIMPIIDKVEGFYVVDIEDHFVDACEVTEEARSCSLASEYRH